MEYYLLSLSEHVTNPIRPHIVDARGPIPDYDKLEAVNAGYFEKKSVDITDMILQPFPMVSLEVKDLLKQEEESLETKALQLFSKDEEHYPVLYFILNPVKADCLAKTVKVNPNGTLDEVILDAEKLPKEKIFMIDGIMERKIVISEYIAEKLLMKDFYGIGFKKVKIER